MNESQGFEEICAHVAQLPRLDDLEKIFPKISAQGFLQEKNVFNLPKVTLAKVNKLIFGSWNRLEYKFLGWGFLDNSGRIKVLFRREKDGLEFWYTSTLPNLIAVYEAFKQMRNN